VTEPFTFTWHDADKTVECKLSGLWDDETMAAWESVCGDFVDSAEPGFNMLSDLRDYPAQRQEFLARHGVLLNMAAARGMRRCATVVERVIPQMQMQRISENGTASDRTFFVSRPEDGWRVLRADRPQDALHLATSLAIARSAEAFVAS
jgi:hypothetical protein